MKKQLVAVNNLDSYIYQACATIYVTKNMILTSGAKDELKKRKICIVYGEAPSDVDCTTVPEQTETASKMTDEEDRERLFYGIAAMAKEELGIDDPEILKNISIKIVDTLRKNI
ncbi:hypothetical protein [Desulforhopalus sp. IMCC35007]|jgi:ethanolamine utilization cobalamin adenosyltransferase|uniref:hypothetical protein n=1 Tax=Desulforhopalus sp. IMCC35007 TaxID=2569543 RepID=UPI0010ADA62D|nr:hypothetical protein [Desulforhopalus sp. IMCC35007]TKB09571.1 hypothetical protein FCL48_08955 [Desulforhopalus sp. IMCC35007]